MKIGISARGLGYTSGGAGEYIRNLVNTLPGIDLNNHYIIYYSHASQVLRIQRPNVTETVLPTVPNLLWDQLMLPIRLKMDSIDICLFLKGTVPLLNLTRSIVSILDLAYFLPQLKAYKYFDTQYMRFMIPASARRADAIIAISQNTKNDILKFIPDLYEKNIYVVYLASALDPSEQQNVVVPDRFGLKDKPYIFFSSVVSPRKNIERTLLALAKIKHQIPHSLVITGGRSWGLNEIDNIIIRLGLEERFVRLGHVNQDELIALYSSASLYIMPSLYEGFSLTILEAMQCGCPVVASNVSSHPEVVGEAGILFDPYSVDDIANAILRVATDATLAQHLRIKGFSQARNFSWVKCASETLAIINGIRERSNP